MLSFSCLGIISASVKNISSKKNFKLLMYASETHTFAHAFVTVEIILGFHV